ncbi:MAG: serine/threonine protein kinase [Candidatus Azotimanducaceae bacterium]|jgi:serine/threonine protein kinase
MSAEESSADNFQHVRQLFEAALDLPNAERAAFLDRECGALGMVRSDVDELLACDADGSELGSLLDRGVDLIATGGVVPGAGTLGNRGRVGPFALRSVLGSGGMGTVYEAEQDEPRRRVALKVLSLGLANEQAVRRFKWEAEVLANLRHPAIAQVHEVGVHKVGDIELPWFAMELVPGARDLISYAQAKDLGQRQRLELLLQVCDAVHHGHLQGVVHRDLKPQNILVDENGRAKVIDFGIARSMANDAQWTEGGVVLGTLHYMSPEQLRGRAVDLRSDIYSLGVVVFELIAGRRPFVFGETTPLIVAETVENQDAPRLSTIVRGIDRDLEVVVQKALRRDADDRYASMAEFADDLRAFLDARPVRARAPSTFYQVRMFARRRAGLVASSAVIFLLVMVALVVVLAQNSELNRRGEELSNKNSALAKNEVKLQQQNTELLARGEELTNKNIELAASRDQLQQQNLELARRQRVSRRVAQFAGDFLHKSSLMAARGPNYTVREALDEAANSIAGETFEDAETEAELRELIGETYRGLSMSGVAVPQLERAVQLWRQADGSKSRRAMSLATSLVVALRENGRQADAEALIESLHADFPDVEREDSELFWAIQHNRAYIMRHAGKLRDAEALFRKTLAARERLLGNDATPTLVTMHNLGNLMLGLGDPEAARDLLTEAVKRARRGKEPEASTLQIVDNLAEAWRDLGDLDKAAKCHRECMAGFEKFVGPDDQLTIGCGYHLLKVLYQQGKRVELESLAKDLLERCERTFGKDDYRTLDVLQALAVAVKDRGDVQQAAVLMNRAFVGVSNDRGEVHPATFNAGHNLTKARIAASDRPGALEISKHLIDLLARDPDPAKQLPPPFPGLTWLLRAQALFAAEQPEQAKVAAAKAIELLSAAVKPDDPLLKQAKALLAGSK